jgi:hypothetical protein
VLLRAFRSHHPSDEKARKFKKLERILFAKVYQLLRNAL